MIRAYIWTLLALTPSAIAAEFGLTGQLFQLSSGSSVNNIKLRWASVSGATTYSVARSTGSGSYSTISSAGGDSYDDYGLTVGSTYSYQISALQGATVMQMSNVVSMAPYTPSGTYSTYDNTKASTASIKSNLYADGVYYQYNYQSFSNGSMEALVQQTSTDGYTFTGSTTVLTGQTVCASVGYSCHLERITYSLHPSTQQIIMWAHLEDTANYDLAQVAVAYAIPGQAFAFGGTYRPLGHDSRDLTFYVDGSAGYLISATNTNTDMNIYSLTSNWTAVADLVVTVNKGAYREAPAMIKSNGWYYLFTSRAAGWFPSQPQYIAAQSVSGPWSPPVVVGNTATFATQSGSVVTLPNNQSAMLADRWSANWTPTAGDNRELMLPLALSPSNAFATYNFYKTVQYSDSHLTAEQAIYGVQTGKILSNYQPSSSSAGTTNLSSANDATQDVPTSYWIPSSVPFWYQVDLGTPRVVSQVDLTTNMVQGSETYYRFNVTGSTDGIEFATLADRSDNTDVGFVASYPTSTDAYRYVRINVQAVINTHNGNEADWAAGVVEATVYGS